MLKKLAEKDKFWREIAFKICKDRNKADDIVNEMYLRRYDNDRGQELTDPYIVSTMHSIYFNEKKTNKLVPVGEIRTDSIINGKFEPNDAEYKFLTRAKQLKFSQRELLELNYDNSLREIQDKYGINYGYVYKVIKEARQTILKNEIYLYNNKRLKNKRMAQSAGLGDTVEKIIKGSGIKRLVDLVTGEKDCGCEKRKEFLNQLWRYKLEPKCLTPDEVKEYHNFILSRKIFLKGNGKAIGKLTKKETEFVCDFFGIVFNQKITYPSCSSCSGTASKLVDMIYKLDTVFVNNVQEQQKEPVKKVVARKPRNGHKITRKKRTAKK